MLAPVPIWTRRKIKKDCFPLRHEIPDYMLMKSKAMLHFTVVSTGIGIAINDCRSSVQRVCDETVLIFKMN